MQPRVYFSLPDQRSRLAFVVGLSLLAALAVCVLGCAEVPAHAVLAQAVVPADAAMTYTVYLPWVGGSYYSPFAISMYGDVNDVAGVPQMQAAGIHGIVTNLSWATIEPQIGQRDWTNFDTKLAAARAAGMAVCVQFRDNPGWAAIYPQGPVTDTQTLIDFVTAMAERYDGDGYQNAPGNPVVDCYSIYNEPDNGDASHARVGYWGYWGNNGAGYADMISRVSLAIHQANPNAKVLSGGIAYDWFTTDVPPGPFVRSFLADMLQALNGKPGGVTKYLDGVDFHYYPISTARWPTIREKTQEIQGILASHRAGTLPLYMSEMGYWSDLSVNSSEMLQAEKLVQMYVQGMSVGIRQMAWYAVFDDGPGTETHGLFHGNDITSPKQAYKAYTTMTEELSGFTYANALTQAGLGGYRFTGPGGTSKFVVWGAPADTRFSLAASCLRVVDLLGTVKLVTDGGPGDLAGATGQVGVLVAANRPTYVETCP